MEQDSDQGVDAGGRMDILIQLYEGAIDFLNRSKGFLESGEGTEFRQMVQRARAIIQAFQSTLDFTLGGEVAKQLNQLYDVMLEQLKIAEAESSPKAVDQVIISLSNLLEGWRSVHPNRS